jgi:hypothetical protein
VIHFLQDFRGNVNHAQLGHILYVGLARKSLKRGGPVRDLIPARAHCSKYLLGFKPGTKDCLTTPVCEVLLSAEILVYVGAETFGKVLHKLLINFRVLIQKMQLSTGGAHEYQMSPINECVAQYQYSGLSWGKQH